MQVEDGDRYVATLIEPNLYGSNLTFVYLIWRSVKSHEKVSFFLIGTAKCRVCL